MSNSVGTAEAEDREDHLGPLTYADINVREYRRPNDAIMEEGDLTTKEKLALMDLLKGYMTMHGNRTVNPRRRELYREFFKVIFSQWDSVEGPEDPPTLTEPSFSHTRVRAGKLRVNHPGPRPSRRPNQMNLASGDGPILPPLGPEPEPDIPKSRARHAGQPVFLGLTLKLEEESYAWLWRDGAGKLVNPKYVEITPELGKWEVRRRAIKNYDIWEKNRITTYNRAVVRTLARRRICKWARHGSEGRGRVDSDDMLRPGVIQELILARDYLAEELAVCLSEVSLMPHRVEEMTI